MIYGIKDVLNMRIFDDEGKFVKQVDYLNNAYLIRDDKRVFFLLGHEVFDVDLMKVRFNNNNELISDFDSEVSSYDIISIGERTHGKRYKAIFEGTIRSEKNEDKRVEIIIRDFEFTDYENRNKLFGFDCEEVFKFKTALECFDTPEHNAVEIKIHK